MMQIDVNFEQGNNIIIAQLVAISYMDEDGKTKYYVSCKGDAASTSYLGLTVVAQQEIAKWGLDRDS